MGAALVEQLAAQLIACADRRGFCVVFDDGRRQADLAEHLHEAAQAQLMGQTVRAMAEIGDAAMSEREQIFRREAAACEVVDTDRVDLVAAERSGRAEEHGRKMRRELLKPARRVAV